MRKRELAQTVGNVLCSVATPCNSRCPRDGRFIEEIGTYNPLTNPSTVNVDADRAQEWIKKGAQPTDTVRGILKKAGVLN